MRVVYAIKMALRAMFPACVVHKISSEVNKPPSCGNKTPCGLWVYNFIGVKSIFRCHRPEVSLEMGEAIILKPAYN